jgi:hypothetical protein
MYGKEQARDQVYIKRYEIQASVSIILTSKENDIAYGPYMMPSQ